MNVSQRELEALIKMANKYDQVGNVQASKAIDEALIKLAAEAEAEAEAAATGKLTNKQRAAIKGFNVAAQRLEKAFGRGVPRAYRKLDELAEEVVKACKACNVDAADATEVDTAE